MPQFGPNFINIPKEIKENPEKFGLTESELCEVKCCNNIAKAPRTNAMLTDEQWETYWKAVKIIKRFEYELELNRRVAKKKKEFDRRVAKEKKKRLKVL